MRCEGIPRCGSHLLPVDFKVKEITLANVGGLLPISWRPWELRFPKEEIGPQGCNIGILSEFPAWPSVLQPMHLLKALHTWSIGNCSYRYSEAHRKPLNLDTNDRSIHIYFHLACTFQACKIKALLPLNLIPIMKCIGSTIFFEQVCCGTNADMVPSSESLTCWLKGNAMVNWKTF